MISKNIVGNYGAIGSGAVDDSTAFAAFNIDPVVQNAGNELVELTIPAGTYKFANAGGAEGAQFTKGIDNLLILGAGAATTTLTDAGVGDFRLGGFGIPQDTLHRAYLEAVPAGATSVQLLIPAEESMFLENAWVLLCGFDMMDFGNPGYPPNCYYFDFLQVSTVDRINGIVRFTSPTRYAYKTTWMFGGTNPDVGPATLIVLDPSFNCSQEIRDITLFRSTQQLYTCAKEFTYRRCTLSAPTGNNVPTVSKIQSYIDCDTSENSWEVDKLIEELNVVGGVHDVLDFQSSSIEQLNISGANINALTGTPKRSALLDSTIGELRMGPLWGSNEQFAASNCVISSVPQRNAIDKGIGDAGVNNTYTMVNGIIYMPKAGSFAPGWAVPGAFCTWTGQYDSEKGFIVLDVTEDADNILVHTNLSGGFPSVPLTLGKLYIRAHPARSATFRNCTGCADVRDWSNAPAGRPLYSWSRRDYTQADLSTSFIDGPQMWGNLQSLKINVTTPYVGVGALTLYPLAQFASFTIKEDDSTFNYQPLINLKQPGERIITASGVINSQSGDQDLVVPEAVWFTGGTSVGVSANGATFGVTIEIVTDQGIPHQQPSLKLRLH